MDSPRRRFDPLALAVHGVAIALIVAIGAYLLASVRWESGTPAPTVRKAVEDVTASVRKRVAPQPPQPAPVARPVPPAPAPVAKPVPTELMAAYGAGRGWLYHVSVEPPLWRDASLNYRMAAKDGALGVDTEFLHAAGQMKFHLGTFAAGDPSHASMRFPGFFMYAAYFNRPLEVGQVFTWEWPWQLPDGQVRPGRVKRFVAEVKQWENLPAPPSAKAPHDTFSAARIEVTLTYLEDGKVRSLAGETLWYVPRFLQVFKIEREGKTPDEGAHRIVAQLAGYYYP